MYCVIFTKAIYFIYEYTYSAGMKERCRDGCRTFLLIAGVVLVPAIFHTLLQPCHPYISIHFMEMIFFHLYIGITIQLCPSSEHILGTKPPLLLDTWWLYMHACSSKGGRLENEKFFELKSRGYRDGIKREETR